jgi:adenylate cyclase
MIRESAELVAVTERWLKAFLNDDGPALANLVSRHSATRYLGTDPGEHWRGTEVAIALPVHIQEIHQRLGFRIDAESIAAFEAGDAGWSIVIGKVVFGDGPERDVRVILVFVMEDGVWRIVLAQNGLVAPNQQWVGIEMTRGLQALVGDIDDDDESTIRSTVTEGTVALMFTDIVDSSIWLTSLGDAAWADVMSWHDGELRRIVDQHGGEVVKTLGDGAMAAFDSTRAAARAARSIQGAIAEATDLPDIEVRIGLHVGEVVQTGEDFLGLAVHKAARIASAAGGGEIMVSNAVSALLGDDPEFGFGEGTDMVLKGLDGVHPVFPLRSVTEPS